MNLQFDHSENTLFEYYSNQDISLFLWEMYQCWMLELSQMDETHLEVSNRQYFFELLTSQVFQQAVPPIEAPSSDTSQAIAPADSFQNSG
jgi:hypothetical protein